MPLSIIILAAGQGTRMKSSRAKVIHHLAGKPMLQHVVDTSLALNPDQVIVVIGHQSEQIREVMQDYHLLYVEQKQQLGTGHAVQQCLDTLDDGNDVLVLYGDVPLITINTLQTLIHESASHCLNILSFIPDDANGYGRIVRAAGGTVQAIVEQKDATEIELKVRESNSGIMYIKGTEIGNLLAKLDNNNAQSEYYLTDTVKHAVTAGLTVSATVCALAPEVSGVNNQSQLADVESFYRSRQAQALMSDGAKLYDPERIDVRGNIVLGSDVEIDVNCIFEGDVKLGNNVRIGANCIIRNAHIGDETVILPFTHIDSATIGHQVSIGPFARIRPGAEFADQVKVGNFVEVKKSRIGKGSKISHLSYIGDTKMGCDVNIGAGTITCNYDGVNKSITTIEDGVFVGSDTQIVAPVTIGKGSTIGAGSTITRDTPAEQLTLSRAKQVTISGWQKPVKK